ncbi:MAG: beta-propeller domain-containing protein [Bifidobacteriaceae bacterium]|nr:beta-propeller domain-containing protein [Bifidobacteriaceae bacterium]
MSKEIFRDMSEQMVPDEEARRALREALAREDGTSDATHHMVERSLRRPGRTGRSRRSRARLFAAVGTVCAVALGAVAILPLTPWFQDRVGEAAARRANAQASASGKAAGDYREAYEALAPLLESQRAAAESPGGSWLDDLLGIFGGASDAGGVQLQMVEDSGSEMAARAAPAEAGSFSETNTQVAGIDEGDVVKTDGRAIYIAQADQIAVVTPDGAGTRTAATIDIMGPVASWVEQHLPAAEDSDYGGYQEMAQIGDIMVSDAVLAVFVQRGGMDYSYPYVTTDDIVGSRSIEDGLDADDGADGPDQASQAPNDGTDEPDSEAGRRSEEPAEPGAEPSAEPGAEPGAEPSVEVSQTPGEGEVEVPDGIGHGAELTLTLLFDVSDPGAPRALGTFALSGYYTAARLVDGTLYLVTDYTLGYGAEIDPARPATFVPLVDTGDGLRPVGAASVTVLPDLAEASYAVASAVDLRTQELTAEIAVLGGANTVYLNSDNLYLAGLTWDDTGSAVTDLARVTLADGGLTLAAQTRLAGSLWGQFALDEYDSHLRVVITGVASGQLEDWGQVSESVVRLEVLDLALQRVGLIDPLVRDEDVESVRFLGEFGYVVTFKQVDPLFALDLGDPAAPVVRSELKIPGFSSYLHPWAEDRLLGVGLDGTETGEMTGYMKLSMFDIADLDQVAELDALPIEYWSADLANHRAYWIDSERNLIGFAAENLNVGTTSYLLFSYGPDGFEAEGELRVVMGANVNEFGYYGPYGGSGVRGIRVGENLYVCWYQGVSVYSLANLELLAAVPF